MKSIKKTLKTINKHLILTERVIFLSAKWSFFNGSIKPEGWLHKQLRIQADGLSGNLDKIWPDIKDSAWIGGKREGWERVPYWLDGFIPLAYLLDDNDLKNRAKNYIDAILDQQRADGWICPCKTGEIPEYDTWAVMLITKALTVWYNYSEDNRIPEVIYKVLYNYYSLLKSEKIHLFNWGKARWYEAFIAINFLYKRYNEDWIIDLAKILKAQGTDYSLYRENWKRPLNKWTYETHVVNIAMMLKSECVSCDILGEEYTSLADINLDIIDKYNSTAAGLFTGDECLSGTSPIQGTELCGVVEFMYSLELLYAYTGDPKWAERLEMAAFNGLVGTISDDMWTHQYDQSANQINCVKFPGKPIFRTNGDESSLFGLEPNYGCCTANFNQGWPKFTQSAFLYDEESILCALTVPCSLETEDVNIKLESNYPFENKLIFTVTSKKDFIFKVRIPSFALNIKSDSEFVSQENLLEFEIKKDDNKTIIIDFETEAVLKKRDSGMYYVQCGSIVYSVPLKYEKIMHEYVRNDVERKYPYCDYELKSTSEWQYGIRSIEKSCNFKGITDIPFSSENPPLTVNAEVQKINWGYEDGYDCVCSSYPQNTEPVSEIQNIELIPYGCAKLRMTELPLIE